MEHQQTPGLLLGMCASDADLFRRVWERVDAPHSLVVPHPAPQPDHFLPEYPLEKPPSAGELARTDHVPEERPLTEEPGLDTPGAEEPTADDFPRPDDQPCLGRASVGYREQLQQYIWEELEGWQVYRHLARRVGGPHARTLAALASEKHRRARRLAAAHFLIAGVRWWPTDRLATPGFSSWLGTLRDRFSAEQRQKHSYRAAACETEDPCLQEMYSELAAENGRHADVVRGVLEGAL